MPRHLTRFLSVLARGRRRPLLAGMAVALWGVVAAGSLVVSSSATSPLDSFAACAEAGYPVSDGEVVTCVAGNATFRGSPEKRAEAAEAVATETFTLLASADSGTATPREQIVIRSQDQWAAWWVTIHSGLVQPPIIPVNFATSNVVLIVGGPKQTTGYNYKVTGITRGIRTTVIDTSESIPTIGCPVQPQRSNRYYIVRTLPLPDPVVFRNSSQSRYCK